MNSATGASDVRREAAANFALSRNRTVCGGRRSTVPGAGFAISFRPTPVAGAEGGDVRVPRSRSLPARYDHAPYRQTRILDRTPRMAAAGGGNVIAQRDGAF